MRHNVKLHNPLSSTSRHSQQKPSRTPGIPIEEVTLGLIFAFISLMDPIGAFTRVQRCKAVHKLSTYQRSCPTRHAVLQITQQYNGVHSAKATCGLSRDLRSCLKQIVWAIKQSGTKFPLYYSKMRFPEKTT